MTSPITKKYPLIIEEHPAEYTGYPFITLISYIDNDILAIIDDSTDKQIKAYILDYCSNENIEEIEIIKIAENWFNNGSTCPISIEFAKHDISEYTKKIFKTLSLNYVKRIIGPVFCFDLNKHKKIKRKKCKPISKDIDINYHTNKIYF